MSNEKMPCPICGLFNIPKLMELENQLANALSAVQKLLDLANGVEPVDFDGIPALPPIALDPKRIRGERFEYGEPPLFFRPPRQVRRESEK